MTEREAIYAYLGNPVDYAFDIKEYKGPRGGLITLVGLKHLDLVIAGTELYKLVQEVLEVELNRWAFYHELTKWCSEYTGTSTKAKYVGKQRIVNGTIMLGNSKYFCVPSSLASKNKFKKKLII